MTPSMTARRATVTELTARIENERHRLYMDSLFSSPSDNLYTETINRCRTVRPNRKKDAEGFWI